MTAQPTDKRRWVVLIFICLFYYLIQGFNFQSFNILLATIVGDMGWDSTQRTAIAGALSAGMIWFVFIAGTTLDKISVKKVLGSAGVLIGILTFIRGQAQGFMLFYVIMFVYGAAAAFLVPACTKMLGLWFPKNELARVNGMLTSASPLGQITANLFGVKIMTALGGWRMLYMCTGIAILVVSLACFVFVKERRSIDAALSSDKITSQEDLRVWVNLKEIAKSPTYWLYVIANMFFLGMIYGGGAMGQMVLQTDPNWLLDKSISGTVPAFNNFASMFAYTILPIIMAKAGLNKHYRKIAIICGVIAPISYFIGYSSHSFPVICAGMAIAGVFYGVIVPAPKVLMMQLPEVSGPRAGTALGAYITFERLAQTVFITMIGALVAYFPAERWGNVMAFSFLLQLVSPLCLFLAGIVEKKRTQKTVTV